MNDKKEVAIASLDNAVQTDLNEIVAKKYSPANAKGRKEMQKAMGTIGKDQHLELARKVARELAKEGLVNIDEVNAEMERRRLQDPNAARSSAAKAWKGSVFSGSEWVPQGFVPSTNPSNHGRPIQAWALRTWLDGCDGVHGTSLTTSAYDLRILYNDFRKRYPKLKLENCYWYIGAAGIHKSFRGNILNEDGTPKEHAAIFGIPVRVVQHSVGCMICPPDPR
jgi:hypothetical protein